MWTCTVPTRCPSDASRTVSARPPSAIAASFRQEARQRAPDRFGRDAELAGAWDPTARDKVLDEDGIVAEVLFPDGVTEMNSPPFGASGLT